ncbi:hypothetical protein BH10PSE15_BH10PSE15_11130 [soil metagenome]
MNEAVGRWTKKACRVFLDRLATSADVRQSAQAAGRSYAAAHAQRRRDAAFADGWDEALLAAYRRLEEELLARAIDKRVEENDSFDAVLALKMLMRHEARRAARPLRGQTTRHTASIEEVERSLRRKLAALGKRRPATP